MTKTPTKTKASKSVAPAFSPDRNYEFGITGRPPSVFKNNLQGDHVTAYGLIEEGFYRALSDLKTGEIDELFNLENRESLRQRRGRVYDFISAIASLDDEKRAESLYLEINKILENYNSDRHSKTSLRNDTKSAQEDEDLDGGNLDRVLRSIELEYKENGEFIRKSLLEMVAVVMTFYNKIPHTSYLPIEGFFPSEGEGARVKTSLNNIEDIAITKEKKASDLNDVINNIVSLIHFPEIDGIKILEKPDPKEKGKVIQIIIPDNSNYKEDGYVESDKKTIEEVLKEHAENTKSRGTKIASPRNNDENSLISALTRHIHIVFSVYPELKNTFDEQTIISQTTQKIITGMNGKGLMGWPSFNNDEAINRISKSVAKGLENLKNGTEENHYKNHKEYDKLVSSDDEEEPTKPRTKIIVKSKKNLTDVKVRLETVLNEEELKELEELRRFKMAVDKKSSFSFQEQLKKEFPALYCDNSVGIKGEIQK